MSISFKPKQVTKRLLSALPPRAREVIVGRYGLGDDAKKQTLESIGQKYDITRERVRQIEAYSLNLIRKSEVYLKESSVFKELHDFIKRRGGIVPSHDLLPAISADKTVQNHVLFLLSLGDKFSSHKEDESFHHRWHIDEGLSTIIHNSLQKVYNDLGDEEIIPESKLIDNFLTYCKNINEEYKQEEILKRWLSMSKLIGKNPLGEWGRINSANVSTKSVRDYAYLVIRQHGEPMHFREVAKKIQETFSKKAHVATTHNELIKDKRFVLVGRGLYALREWGYSSGIVRDVIADVIRKYGKMTKEEVVKKVLQERFVKENTVLINLQNSRYFVKDKDNKYSVK